MVPVQSFFNMTLETVTESFFKADVVTENTALTICKGVNALVTFKRETHFRPLKKLRVRGFLKLKMGVVYSQHSSSFCAEFFS